MTTIKSKTKLVKSSSKEKELLVAENKGFEECLRESAKNLSDLIELIKNENLDALEYIEVYRDRLNEELEMYEKEIH